jgi:methyl-accepting chemotaxis protein
MKLKFKLPLILFIAFVVVISLTFTMSLANSAKTDRESQYETGRAMATVRAEEVRGFLEKKATELRALEQNILAIARLNDRDKAEILGKLVYGISDRPAVSDVYVVFERGAYFGADKTEAGKYYNIEAFLAESGKRELFFESNYEVADDDEWYNGPKETKKLHLTEPYDWTYPGEARPRKMVTLSAPVMSNGQFIGAAGIDLQLDLMQKHLFDNMIDDKKGAYAALVSNEGVVAAHPNAELILRELGEDTDPAGRRELKDAVKNGMYHRVIKESRKTGNRSLVSYVPMLPEGLELPWSLAYTVSLNVVQAEANKARVNIIMLGISCAVAWGVFLLLFMSAIFGKVTRTVAGLRRMTEGDGDLTIRFDERGKDEFAQMARGLNRLMDKLHDTIETTGRMTDGNGDLTVRFDERGGGDFGRMARGLNRLMEKLHTTIKMTQTEAKNLSDTSSTLLELSNELSQASETTLNASIRVERESEETSGNVRGIASEAERASLGATVLLATAEQMGMNMNTVINAVGKMNADFNIITADTRESKTVADEAIGRAAAAMSAMDALEASVKEIRQFTNIIKTIAQKTDLLALNASVEAVHAGDAGKGFAVVANEVKMLATQSASNADDITQRIENIQAGTADAIDVMRKISAIIKTIGGSANSISENVERQKKVSEELSGTAKETNIGVQQVVSAIGDVAASIETSARHAVVAADGAKSVSDNIGIIHGDAEKTNAYSTKLKGAATSLKNTAVQLDAVVCRFKT